MADPNLNAAPPPIAAAPETPKEPLASLLDRILEQAPGLIKEEEGIIPSHTLAKMWGFADRIKDAKFLPANVRGDRASVFYLLAMAQELGARWTHAMRSLYMTPDGKAGIQGDLALALLYKNGFKLHWPVQEDDRAVCQIVRPDCKCAYSKEQKKVDCACGRSGEMEVTFAEMEASGFTHSTKDGGRFLKHNWKNKKNMLRWRSLAFAWRFYAADVLGGVYLYEEIQDMALTEERTVETVQAAAGQAPDAPKVDEHIIPPELEQRLRAAAHSAGKSQGWALAKLAEAEGKLKAEFPASVTADSIDGVARLKMATALIGAVVASLTKPSETTSAPSTTTSAPAMASNLPAAPKRRGRPPKDPIDRRSPEQREADREAEAAQRAMELVGEEDVPQQKKYGNETHGSETEFPDPFGGGE